MSKRLRSLLPFVQQMEDARIARDLIGICARGQFDICLVVGGHTVTPATVRRLRALCRDVILWTTDVPHPGDFKNIVAAAPEYSRILCAGTEAVEILAALPGCHPVWLPFACDPACHAPQALLPEEERLYRRDIVFCGSYYPNRRHILEVLAAYDAGIWGPLWGRLPSDSLLKPKAVEARLDFSVWTKIYAAAKIVMVVHYQDGVTPCYQASPKLFEAMACGAFVLCDDQKDARTLFRDQEHVVFFKDAADLKDKVDHYLADPAARTRIAACGQREVLEKHTYQHRMRTIISVKS